jgi:hypothetical protein
MGDNTKRFVVAHHHSNELSYLYWFEVEADRNDGVPNSGWSTSSDEALRLSHAHAVAFAALLDGAYVTDLPKPDAGDGR